MLLTCGLKSRLEGDEATDMLALTVVLSVTTLPLETQNT